jgi:hypothetical protein
VIAAVLGVAVVGIVLIYRGHRRNAEEINRLRAEVTAAKIAALQQAMQQAVPDGDEQDEQPEPVRRKRHLSLYLGGFAFPIAWIGDRLRHAWERHRAATVSTAVAVATVTAAAAYQYTSSADTRPSTSRAQPPVISAPPVPGTDEGDGPAPSPSATSDSPDRQPAPESGSATPAPEAPVTAGATGTADTRATQSPSRGEPPAGTQSDDAPGGGEPSRGEPGDPEATPQPTRPAPPTTPAPSPTLPPGEGGPGDGSSNPDCLIHVGLPPLLDLCV